MTNITELKHKSPLENAVMNALAGLGRPLQSFSHVDMVYAAVGTILFGLMVGSLLLGHWVKLLWVVSFGGQFWGGIAAVILSTLLFTSFYLALERAGLPSFTDHAMFLSLCFLGSLGLFIVSMDALDTTIPTFASLTTAERVADRLMGIPLLFSVISLARMGFYFVRWRLKSSISRQQTR